MAGELGGDNRPDGLHPLISRRMEERAVRERWPMSEQVRIKILQRLAGIVDPETEEGSRSRRREVIAAARAIMSADKLNLEQRRIDAGLPTGGDQVDRDLVEEALLIRERRRERSQATPR